MNKTDYTGPGLIILILGVWLLLESAGNVDWLGGLILAIMFVGVIGGFLAGVFKNRRVK